jgi:hypothetical protein
MKKDITVKVSEFLQITEIISRTLKPSQVQKHSTLKTYSSLALLTSVYGCEAWSTREHDNSRITSAETKCVRRMEKYTWQDYGTNDTFYENLKLAQL